MPASPVFDHTALLRLLPEDRVGGVERIEPITLGLSGAGVYAVTTSRGALVLRVQGHQFEGSFPEQVRVLLRAAEAGVAPAVLHVDEAARAVVSVRVPGVPMAAALADQANRGAVFASVVDRLRTLHALAAERCGTAFSTATEMAHDAAQSLHHLTDDAGATAKKALVAAAK